MYNKTNVHRRRRTSTDKGACYSFTAREPQYNRKPTDAIFGEPSLAMVYSVSQSWRYINDGLEGFERGTIFDELNKPFSGDKCKRGGICK